MKTIIIMPLLLILLFSGAAANPNTSSLIVFIVVDELDNEQLLLLQSEFSNDGFNRISQQGMRFMAANSSDISGYPGTRMATLFSGSPPSTHGVIAETWLNRQTNKFITPASFDSASLNTTINYNHSKTIADYLKSFYGPQAKNAIISINAPWSIYAGGYAPDYMLAFNTYSGEFYNALLPKSFDSQWLNKFNNQINKTSLTNRNWGPIKDITNYIEYRYLSAEPKAEFRSFHYPMKSKTPQTYERVAASPFANTLLRDLAVAFLAETDFGKNGVPNLLTINFTTRPFTKTNGTILPVEKEDMLLRLDKNISSLLSFLDNEYGKNNYLVALTAAANSAPDRITAGLQGTTTGTVEFNKITALLNLYLMAKYGQGQWVMGIFDNFVYLNHELINNTDLNLQEIQKETAHFIMEFSGIKQAVVVWEKSLSPENSSMYSANLFPKRMPDIVISLLQGWQTNASELGTRQTGFSGNNFVPLIIVGPDIKRGAWFEHFNIEKVTPLILQQFEINHPGIKYIPPSLNIRK